MVILFSFVLFFVSFFDHLSLQYWICFKLYWIKYYFNDERLFLKCTGGVTDTLIVRTTKYARFQYKMRQRTIPEITPVGLIIKCPVLLVRLPWNLEVSTSSTFSVLVYGFTKVNKL